VKATWAFPFFNTMIVNLFSDVVVGNIQGRQRPIVGGAILGMLVYIYSLWLGYLRALGEAGSDDLSTFDAELIRRKIEARHSPLGTDRDISDNREIYGL
jgi:hypothetical protein